MHLQKEGEISIPGYSQMFRNDRSGNSGVIMLAVKIKHKNNYIRDCPRKGNCGYC